MAELKLDQLDLMLIHGMWTLSENEAVDVWRGLDIDAKVAGLTKHIGVSNFEQKHIERLIAETDVKPAALQLEYLCTVPSLNPLASCALWLALEREQK